MTSSDDASREAMKAASKLAVAAACCLCAVCLLAAAIIIAAALRSNAGPLNSPATPDAASKSAVERRAAEAP